MATVIDNGGDDVLPRTGPGLFKPPVASAPLNDAVTGDGQAASAPLRAFVVYGLGTLLLIANAFFGTYAYVVVQALIWTQTSLQRGPVVVLFILVLLNLAWAKGARRFALSRHEMLVLYAMLCAGTCSAGYGFVQILINQMASPFYFATGGNGFKDRLWPYIPAWLAPQDPDVINGFFRGNSTLYQAVVLRGWAVPVLTWTAFIFAIFWTLLCATTLARRAWVEEERLTFPLTLLPLEMTEGSATGAVPPFWRNRLMWAGFAAAGVLESFNFLNFLYPSVPTIPIKPSMGPNHLESFMTVRPWNAVGTLTLAFYPFVIGIAYLLSLDVSFSCWFLYLVGKASLIACSALGLSEGGGGGAANRAPFLREQGIGAFVGIALFSAWMARRSLVLAWREMQTPTGADRNELMSYRLALRGGAVGILCIAGFLLLLGFSPLMAVLFTFAYLCVSITLARIVSEAGAGWAWAPGWSTTSFVGDAIGASHLDARQLTGLYGYTSWMGDMRDNPAPQFASALKLGQGARLSPRAFLKPLLFASLFGILCAFWAHLDLYYQYGAATAKVRPALASGATTAARNAVSMMITPTLQDTPGMGAAFAGLLLAVGFSVLRQMFPWWPLHPLGYALATTQTMEYMWCPFLIAWAAKLITLRYGGIKAYRAALPFFLGLILGDYVIPTLWGVFGMATGYQQYMAFPH